MIMKYQIDSYNFEDVINNINKVINDELIPLTSKMKKAITDTKWEGIGATSFSETYNDVMNRINDIPLKLTVCTTFLERGLSNYEECYSSIEEMIKEIQEEIIEKQLRNEMNLDEE